jgi:anti-anti-sigma regulatory factor
MHTLPPNFDNVAAVEFFDLARMLETSSEVTLDAAPTTRITTLAIQVLIALENTLQQQGHKLFVANMSDDFRQTLGDIGLSDVVKRWTPAAA